MRCSSCGSDNPANARFCNQCGNPLGGARTPEEWAEKAPIQYTPRHLVERILAAQAALGGRGDGIGERKIITALFADMAGSTALIQTMDPEDARSLIDPVLALMMEAVHHYEGYVAKSLGDGILALFGAPIAHEDHAHRAILAALRMQDAMRFYTDSVNPGCGSPLRIRVGIHTGEVVVRSIRTEDLQTDYDPVGQTIHLASRLEGLAPPGSIVISETTYRLVEGLFEVKAMGVMPVKGVDEPVSLFEALGPGAMQTRLQVATSRGLIQFVGRQAEVEQLRAALLKAKAGQGQVVSVVGEPGVGKSRLFYEFKQGCGRDCRVLETFSVSFGKAFAYLPLIELMKRYFEFGTQDADQQCHEKVAARLQALNADLKDGLPYLLELLGLDEPAGSMPQMDPELWRRRTFDVIRQLLIAESLIQPLVVIFDDLQWLDSETATFLDVLIEGIADAPILLLVNYRPEYCHHWARWSHYSQLRLESLDEFETDALLRALLGEDPSLAQLCPLVATRADGNPFFVEEMIQTLVEEEMLSGSPGHYHLKQLPESLHIPTTVRGVLSARLDRLPAEAKTLLQTAAVIGKEFTWSLVRRVADRPEEELRRLLFRLEQGEFLYQRPSFPEIAYCFKHALTQEVVYGSLLLDQRRRLHERTAEVMELLFADRLGECCRELAHHYRHSSNLPKAVHYLVWAGERSANRCAIAEAVEQLATALELLEQLPDTLERARQELSIRLLLGPVWMMFKGYAAPEVEKIYRRAEELCQQIGETPELFSALFGRVAYYLVRGELRFAWKLARQLLELSDASGDADQRLEAQSLMGLVLFFRGKLDQARDHLQQSVATYEARRHPVLAFLYGLDPAVLNLAYLALLLELAGEPVPAKLRQDEALALAQRLSHPPSLALALNLAAVRDQIRGEVPEVQARSEVALDLSAERGFSLWSAFGGVLQGWAMTGLNQVEQGIRRMRQGLEAYRVTGAGLFVTYFDGLLVEALVRAGTVDAALEAVDEALSLSESIGGRFYEAELYRLRGECLLVKAAAPEAAKELTGGADSCFQQAIVIARRQGARLLMWRALLSRAQLQIRQGRTDAARRSLQAICETAKGAETGETLAARALLLQQSRRK